VTATFAMIMKQTKKIIIITTVAATAIVCLFASYHLGSRRSTARARILYGGTFVAELAALQDLRNNRPTEAIDRLESHCYCWARILLEHPAPRKSMAIKRFMPELAEYRDQHAADPENWSPTERGLEALLTEGNWRRSEHIGAP
jgi:hypothetical protein